MAPSPTLSTIAKELGGILVRRPPKRSILRFLEQEMLIQTIDKGQLDRARTTASLANEYRSRIEHLDDLLPQEMGRLIDLIERGGGTAEFMQDYYKIPMIDSRWLGSFSRLLSSARIPVNTDDFISADSIDYAVLRETMVEVIPTIRAKKPIMRVPFAEAGMGCLETYPSMIAGERHSLSGQTEFYKEGLAFIYHELARRCADLQLKRAKKVFRPISEIGFEAELNHDLGSLQSKIHKEGLGLVSFMEGRSLDIIKNATNYAVCKGFASYYSGLIHDRSTVMTPGMDGCEAVRLTDEGKDFLRLILPTRASIKDMPYETYRDVLMTTKPFVCTENAFLKRVYGR